MDRPVARVLTPCMADILILGGTGTTGRRIAEVLRSAGHPVRVAARRNGDVRADLGDPATWTAALDGVEAVYVLEPDLRDGVDHDTRVPAFTAAAVEAGVRRIVLLSAHGVGLADDAHPLKSAERAVSGSGIGWTILRPGWFAQNFSEGFWRPYVLGGAIALPTGDGATAFVDADDIAAVAAAALTDGRHAGQTYGLTGPRALTMGEAARILGAAAGREVRHADVPAEAYVNGMVAAGVPDDVARRLAGMLLDIREGRDLGVSDGVERALGRPPRTFEEFAADAAARGCWD